VGTTFRKKIMLKQEAGAPPKTPQDTQTEEGSKTEMKADAKTYPDWMTPKQRAWQAAHDDEQEALRRQQCDLLQFWRACAHKPCRRARACRGDPDLCFDDLWPQVPEATKVAIRAALAGRG
jgi:hypothetical protein